MSRRLKAECKQTYCARRVARRRADRLRTGVIACACVDTVTAGGSQSGSSVTAHQAIGYEQQHVSSHSHTPTKRNVHCPVEVGRRTGLHEKVPAQQAIDPWAAHPAIRHAYVTRRSSTSALSAHMYSSSYLQRAPQAWPPPRHRIAPTTPSFSGPVSPWSTSDKPKSAHDTVNTSIHETCFRGNTRLSHRVRRLEPRSFFSTICPLT